MLLVVLAPEINRKYDRLYAYLQDDVTRRRPSVDLTLKLLCRGFEETLAGRAFFRETAPLIREQLLVFADETDGSVPLLGRFLKMDDRIVDYLLHDKALDPRLATFLQPVPATDAVADLLLAPRSKLNWLAWSNATMRRRGRRGTRRCNAGSKAPTVWANGVPPRRSALVSACPCWPSTCRGWRGPSTAPATC